jgi:cobalt-zinc-cadmium efflux system protein
MSDALHDFGDSLSLGTAWYFQKKSEQGRTESYTYGYKRFSIVGAFVNSIVLIIGSIFIIQESIQRLFNPEPANAKGMILLAVLGILVNGAAMFRLKKGTSVNEKVVSLHLLEDVLGWVAVLIGSVIMLFVDLPIIDPILSMFISLFILVNVYQNIKPALQIILQGVPHTVSGDEVKKLVLSDHEIADVHDYHLWSLDGLHHVISLHVVVKENIDLKKAEGLKEKLKNKLKKLNVVHATIEVEFDPDHEIIR